MINLVGIHILSRSLERPALGEVKGPEGRRGEWKGGEGKTGEGQILDVRSNPSPGHQTRSDKLLSLIHS